MHFFSWSSDYHLLDKLQNTITSIQVVGCFCCTSVNDYWLSICHSPEGTKFFTSIIIVCSHQTFSSCVHIFIYHHFFCFDYSQVTGNLTVLMQSILKLEDGRTNVALSQSTEVPAENTSTATKECVSFPLKEGIDSAWSWCLYFSLSMHMHTYCNVVNINHSTNELLLVFYYIAPKLHHIFFFRFLAIEGLPWNELFRDLLWLVHNLLSVASNPKDGQIMCWQYLAHGSQILNLISRNFHPEIWLETGEWDTTSWMFDFTWLLGTTMFVFICLEPSEKLIVV